MDTNCEHKRIYFASGDYYIYCTDCSARWVMTDPQGVGDDPMPKPENSNIGSAALLSGEERFTDESK